MSESLRPTTVLFNCGTRVRGNYSRLEVEAFGTHQVDRTDGLFCPQTSALSPNVHSLTFSIVDNLTFYIALHCAPPAHLLSRPALIFSLIHSPRENRTQIRLPESINTFHPVQRFTLYSITEKFGPQMGLSRKHKYAAAPTLLDIPNLEQASATKSLPKIA